MWARRGIADIKSLPGEILYGVFGNLDQDTLRACMLTCRTWSGVSEYVLYTEPRLYSSAGLEKFIQNVQAKDLCGAVRSLHIRGKRNYSSTASTGWILQVPHRLSALLLNIRSISFEHLESVEFTEAFWQELESFRKVTELRLRACRLASYDAHNMFFTFPNLTVLSLSHVGWATESSTRHRPERWDRTLPLRSLELGHLNREEYVNALCWLGSFTTVRELALLQVSPEARAMYHTGEYLKILSGSLETLTFRPLTMCSSSNNHMDHVNNAVHELIRLHTLRLEVMNLEDRSMRWVYRLLEAARVLPLRNITMDFTLDIKTVAHLSESWIMTNERLSTYWLPTLERVRLTHHPVGRFVSDSEAVSVVTSRLPALVKRRLLEVHVGERYDDNLY